MFFSFHRDGFVSHLERLQVYLLRLQNERNALQTSSEKRSMLMQQASYVAEAEAVGPSLTNHPLNTLTQRYSTYKRTKNEYANSKEALDAMQALCQQQMCAYRGCMKAIETHKMTDNIQFLVDILSNFKAMGTPHAFEMVKEFLDNSAQMAIYLQSCQLSGCLDDLVERLIEGAQHALAAIDDYGAVTRYHPPSMLANHRLTKWAEWCARLIEQPSVPECRDVASRAQTTFGKKPVNNVLVQQVMAFSYQMQTNICDIELRLQKSGDRLHMEADELNDDVTDSQLVEKYTIAFEAARKSIRLFLHDSPSKKQSNVFALHCVSITTLCDLNKRLLMMENAAANAGENMVDLTFNGNWVLDELYAHSAIMCEIAFIVESAHRDLATNVLTNEFLYAEQCLRHIQLMHENVRDANEQFSASILTGALHGVISENDGVLDVIGALSIYQDILPDLLVKLNLLLRRSGMLNGGDHSTVTATVGELRQKFDTLKQQFEQCDELDAGAKLFLSMNELFEQLDDKYDQLIDHLKLLHLRDDQRKIDQMKSSLELAV